MKRLSLIRHAKSSWDDTVSRDFDRPLNAKGTQAALSIGTFMHNEKLSFDHILASPAVRVIETLDHVRKSMTTLMEPEWERRIYLSSSATLMDVIRTVPDTANTLLLAGHNPGLEDLVLDLVPDDGTSPLRDEIEEKYPTAAFAEMELSIEKWADIKDNVGTILRFTRPRDLDPNLGPDYV